jgi:(p)ppGpp synthase/HD superfamily hydrolase
MKTDHTKEPQMEQKELSPYFTKRRIALTHYLAGRGYYMALRAMAYVEKIATGVRKDGLTPEFQHMLEIALHVITLRDVAFEEETIAVALLHDVMEDYGIRHHELEKRFGARVADAVEKISKIVNGVKKPYDIYFADMGACPIASLVKGCDRAHNFQSMPTVFKAEKQAEYVAEGETWFLPMLKEAQRNFPEQFMAYQNVRHHLKSQMALIKHSLLAAKTGQV